MKAARVHLSIAIILFSVALFGCEEQGSIWRSQTPDSIPITGAAALIETGYQRLADGAIESARATFNVVVNDRPKNTYLSQAKVGLGYCDVRQKGSQEGLGEFQEGYATDASNPDARVGLAFALVTRGTAADLQQAVMLLTGLSATGDPRFEYKDRFNLKITNAAVHAVLAYAYRLLGDVAKSKEQADIARELDANVDDTVVDQILAALAFIPDAN